MGVRVGRQAVRSLDAALIGVRCHGGVAQAHGMAHLMAGVPAEPTLARGAGAVFAAILAVMEVARHDRRRPTRLRAGRDQPVIGRVVRVPKDP